MSSTTSTSTRKSIRSAAKPWIIQMVRPHTWADDGKAQPNCAYDSPDWNDYKAFPTFWDAQAASDKLERQYDYLPVLGEDGKISLSGTRSYACGGWGYQSSHFRIVLINPVAETNTYVCEGWTEDEADGGEHHDCSCDGYGHQVYGERITIYRVGVVGQPDQMRQSWPNGWEYRKGQSRWGYSCPECVARIDRYNARRAQERANEAEAASRKAETVAASDILAGWTTAETETDAQA